ncbi:OTU domain-containing protein 3 [Monoraphidium neglectum]|uniref:OTU domain-containing protein 3 n=1 Tax=Monoraphidium neglectum TaxID=145388 RepID=A0A0D2K8G5_9CHLO|nr:OTU domain-containing protein 3 [Monoraphidium neglectum]KIZ06508.1 OTU domain-containing protein 3 [Monoraphidium neglectum]|eukprot:XP_013905527.1 OTU domain-containing protein 3 [Monoraphidium neglectum]
MGKAKDAQRVKAKKAANSGSADATPGLQKASAAAKDKKSKGKQGGGLFFGDPLERELAAVGLRVAKITADGNCLFRAVGDQTEGDEGRHTDLRQRACDLMVERREEFEPFVEDDQGFETYIKRMRKDGVWGGHMELQALSLLMGANVYVYQEGQPRWTVRNHPDHAPSIHLSYHGGEHYNSVRLLDDYTRGPPRTITLGAGGATAAAIAKVI